MDKEAKIMIKSYQRLFYLTGRIEFFMAAKSIEKTLTPILLDENKNEEELSL